MLLNLNYKHRLALSFGILLTTNDLAIAKDTKNTKEVASVLSTIRKTPAGKSPDKTDKTVNKKLQGELEAENALNRALLEKKLAGMIAQIEQLRLEKEHKRLHKEIEEESIRETHDKSMRLLSMEKEKILIEIELAQAKFTKQMEQHNIQIAELEKQAQLERGRNQLLQEAKNRLQTEMDVLNAKAEREKRIPKMPIYLKDPLRKKDNILVLSDRCIELTGYISPWKANYIVDQIQYFNNKNSHHPIFIVIGSSPGGSVQAGFHILQAMKHSKAPVYVVVKEWAASMAALITTLATKSYAYPNASILHHEPAGYWGFWGCNLREAKEQYEELNKIWKRLGGEVAKKMGISLKDFSTKLYQKSIYGNWEEYADNAKKLKWVDFVIHGMEDSAVSVLPDSANYTWRDYRNKYYGCDKAEEIGGASEEVRYYALAPHDFDYSYRSKRNAPRGNVGPQD